MKLNAINLMLYVLAKYYGKSNEYDVAHFHARGILTAITYAIVFSTSMIANETINTKISFDFFGQSKIHMALLMVPIFVLITLVVPNAKTVSAITIDDAEQKRGWRLFWTLMAITVFLFLFSVYLKHGVIIKL